MKSYNLYIHVPFCLSKCNYCAFFSRACKKPDWQNYERNIITELKYWAEKLGKIFISTIFFGGGTPSLMPTQNFENIIKTIKSCFNLDPDCEITLEANPGTLDKQKLKDFYNAGVNRLSIGIQSLNDEKLKFLGRVHNAEQALFLLNSAQKLGLRVSADFIYGLPNETACDVIKICKDINSLGLSHCSMYELTIEQGTPFGKANLQMPSNDEMAEMYKAISETLDLPRYEVSNYAKPGEECKHNQNVWDGESYIGIGNGAAGRILINDVWYEQMGNQQKFEKISNETRALERLITGMRQVRGIKLDSDIKKIINFDFINKSPTLLKINSENRLATTEKGMLILDDLLLNLTR